MHIITNSHISYVTQLLRGSLKLSHVYLQNCCVTCRGTDGLAKAVADTAGMPTSAQQHDLEDNGDPELVDGEDREDGGLNGTEP